MNHELSINSPLQRITWDMPQINSLLCTGRPIFGGLPPFIHPYRIGGWSHGFKICMSIRQSSASDMVDKQIWLKTTATDCWLAHPRHCCLHITPRMLTHIHLVVTAKPTIIKHCTHQESTGACTRTTIKQVLTTNEHGSKLKHHGDCHNSSSWPVNQLFGPWRTNFGR